MGLNRLVKFSLVLTLVVIMLGAYTRLSDAGLGCPDWPGCYGQLMVPSATEDITSAELAFPERPVEADKAWLEMIHRYIAGLLGLMILALLIVSWKQDHAPKILPLLIAIVVIAQATLGMLTVTMKLMPFIVMLHLVGGFTIFSLLFILYLRTKPLRIPGGDIGARKLAPLALIALLVLIVQIILGGWTSTNYAALVCTELPLCESGWYSKLDFIQAFSIDQGTHQTFEFGVLEYPARMTIHITHRIGALITAIVLLTLAIKLFRHAHSNMMRQAAIYLLILLTLQISLGISNIVLNLPLAIAVTHNAIAALLLLNLVYLNYATWRKA